jgi:predicted nucleic acid-binding protein
MGLVMQSATLDSSFWINAHRCGLLPHVLARFELHYPPEVGIELSEEFASGREFWRLVREGVLVEVTPTTNIVLGFGPGERAAMNVALQHPGWVLLMDDRKPLLEAQRLGLRTVCTPVLITELYIDGQLDVGEALESLARLAAMQTVSPTLIEAALAQLELHRAEREKQHGE